MSARILVGDVLVRLRELADESVHCVTTSPPYWGLRSYLPDGHPDKCFEMGQERTPEEFVAKMVAVFREVRRVLRSDGVCWVNMGDCYATGAGKVGDRPGGGEQGDKWAGFRGNRNGHEGKQAYSEESRGIGPMTQPNRMPLSGLKPKDLVGIPWRLAFALQADGWWLRQDIIWSKPNPMPESVTDRCTKAHEYLFLLTKSARYNYSADAIKEPCVSGDNGSSYTSGYDEATKKGLGQGPRKTKVPGGWDRGSGGHGTIHRDGRTAAEYQEVEVSDTRNKRSVWEIATEAFPEAHFATFPTALVEPCILAGCPEGGTVLDPFSGSGTTGVVALRYRRNYIGIELNPEYAAMSERRIREDNPMFNTVTIEYPEVPA